MTRSPTSASARWCEARALLRHYERSESFGALVLIEGLDEAAVRAALHHLRTKLLAEDHAALDALPLYRPAFSLPKRLLPD